MAQYVTLFPSKARTASTNSQDVSNWQEHTGLVLTIDATEMTASPSVVFTIQGKDPASGKYYTILASAAVTSSGITHVLRVHPDLTTAANSVAKDMLPAVWRVSAVAGDSDSLTYSVGASMI